VLRRLRIENLVLIREADLAFGPGLNAVTGETGAGKTILAQAIGLLLGASGDAGLVGPDAAEAYVEAELDLPEELLGDEAFASLAELRPRREEGLVAARRVFADGRTRAYAWGRSVAREDLAVLVESLIAMSGQFEQRRLARPAYQLELLDAFAGEEQLRRRAEHRRAWRELGAARRRRDELAGYAARREEQLAELRELVARTEGMEPGAEEALRAERERLRHTTELAAAAAAAAEALAPELGHEPGAAELAVQAGRGLAPVAALAPELAEAERELAEAGVRLREAASSLRAFLASLEAEPGRLEAVEAELDRIAEAKRRFGAVGFEELLATASAAAAELAAVEGGVDPLADAERALADAEARVSELARELSGARRAAAPAFAAAVSEALRGLGIGDGELRVELSEREPGQTGRDAAAFLVSPNPGLGFAPVAETASGGELSRIALALRVAAHAGEPTVIFDEIDAGVGGVTAHAVADALRRLAETAQVVTITHLPQIASAAGTHLRVEKVPGDPTHTRIERLGEQDRRAELERMLGGAEFLALLAAGEERRG
jgi:DNA repair protein RecN (Recombination protein N)